jgi:hypothetical protein
MKRPLRKYPSCDIVPLKCQAVKHLSSNILFERTISVLSDEEFLSPTLEGGGGGEGEILLKTYKIQ